MSGNERQHSDAIGVRKTTTTSASGFKAPAVNAVLERFAFTSDERHPPNAVFGMFAANFL